MMRLYFVRIKVDVCGYKKNDIGVLVNWNCSQSRMYKEQIKGSIYKLVFVPYRNSISNWSPYVSFRNDNLKHIKKSEIRPEILNKFKNLKEKLVVDSI
jgi:hypothetical protein